MKIYQKSTIFFSKRGGARARRAGPGSAFVNQRVEMVVYIREASQVNINTIQWVGQSKININQTIVWLDQTL